MIKKLYISLIVIAIFTLFLMYFYNKNDELDKYKFENNKREEILEVDNFMVGGLFATKENDPVNVDIDYFKNFKIDITFNQLVTEIGEPTGYVGSGLIRPYYKVGEVFVIVGTTLDSEGYFNIITTFAICDAQTTLYTIDLR
jgi:hypothetical protein